MVSDFGEQFVEAGFEPGKFSDALVLAITKEAKKQVQAADSRGCNYDYGRLRVAKSRDDDHQKTRCDQQTSRMPDGTLELDCFRKQSFIEHVKNPAKPGRGTPLNRFMTSLGQWRLRNGRINVVLPPATGL